MGREKQLPCLTDDRDRPFTRISPSILSADFAHLSRDCNVVLQDGADWLHCDIMVIAALKRTMCLLLGICSHCSSLECCSMGQMPCMRSRLRRRSAGA